MQKQNVGSFLGLESYGKIKVPDISKMSYGKMYRKPWVWNTSIRALLCSIAFGKTGGSVEIQHLKSRFRRNSKGVEVRQIYEEPRFWVPPLIVLSTVPPIYYLLLLTCREPRVWGTVFLWCADSTCWGGFRTDPSPPFESSFHVVFFLLPGKTVVGGYIFPAASVPPWFQRYEQH